MARKKKAKRKTKRKATPAQLRNLAKGRAKLAKMRGKKKTRRKRRTKRNPSRGNFLVARNTIRTGRNPTRPSSRALPHYGIKANGRYFDGAGFTKKPADAARWKNLNKCKNVAQRVADATGKSVSVVDLK